VAQGRFRSERTKDKGATADRGDDGTMSRLLGGSDDGGEVMMMLFEGKELVAHEVVLERPLWRSSG